MIARVEKRDVVKAILFSVITCGLYGIYWFIALTDDASNASGDHNMSGLASFLLTLVTCGLYGFYWAYQMGKKVAMAQQKRNLPVVDNSVLYLVLQVFGLAIVNYVLVQSELNKLADFDATAAPAQATQNV